MKKCPFCAEEIQDEAIKCRYCNEFIEQRASSVSDVKWYFRNYTMIIAFIIFGPFMLPLVWFNPRFEQKIKIIISAVAVVIGVLVLRVTVASVNNIKEYYSVLEDVYQM